MVLSKGSAFRDILNKGAEVSHHALQIAHVCGQLSNETLQLMHVLAEQRHVHGESFKSLIDVHVVNFYTYRHVSPNTLFAALSVVCLAPRIYPQKSVIKQP